jgi:hypothetical protein
MMKRFVLLSWLLLLFINFDIISQSKEENKKNFYYAESLLLSEDYKEALFQYQQLLRIYPDNSNFKFRIGQCYLNIRGEKVRAITYLEDAVKNINPQYTKGKFGETGAPSDALYYLANAYRINNQIEKAIETYKVLRNNLNSELYDSTIVNFEIQSCLNARALINKPVYVKEKNIGSIINSNNSEFNPVISDNEDIIVFSRSQTFYDALLYSIKTKGQWSTPRNMNEILKFDRDIFPTSLSIDGKVLYLYSSAEYDGIIYSSRFENNTWAPLVKLNDNINTKYWESHATVSHDNKKLYFTSNRKGTLGGLDIYVSKRDSTGDWGPAVNLGPVINTPYNEESPFLSKDDKTLFFSSRGHYNMGGFDIFYSTLLDNGEWSVPMNIGYPLNTTDDDVFYEPMNDGYEGYISKDQPGGFGKQDIYRIEKYTDDHPRKFIVRGVAKITDPESILKDSVKISTTNIRKTNQKLTSYANPGTGEYYFQIPQGNYNITYEADGSQKTIRNFDIPLTYPYDTLELPVIILPKTELAVLSKTESDKTIPVIKVDTILFAIKTEPKPLLTGEQKQGYVQNMTDNEFAALIASLRNRATEKLSKVVADAGLENRQAGRADDLISYLKEEAAKKSINAEEVDKLALRVAVMDNILTQAAVDLLAKYTDGELNRILSELDIYKANLKTWTDLQEYVSERSGGRISPEELSNIAKAIFTDIDPSILILKEKILAFSENYEGGSIVRQSVAVVDTRNIKTKEKWLLSFFNESVKQGLTINQLSEMLAVISSLPETGARQYLSDLTAESEEPLRSSLQSIDLNKEKNTLPKDLIMFLLVNKDKEKYPEEAVFKSIANLIISKDIPSGVSTSQRTTGKGHKSWILGVATGALLLFFFIIFRRRRKRESKKTDE